jgi:type IV secretion system protein VirB10
MSGTPEIPPDGVEGERTVSAVAGEQRRRLSRSQGVALIALAGGLASLFILVRPETPPADPRAEREAEALRVGQRGAFEPARLPPAPPPLPATPISLPVLPPAPPPLPIAPLQLPGGPAQDPLAAARRAPLMAFGGQGSTAAATAPAGASTAAPDAEDNELAARLVPTRLEGVRANLLRNRPMLVTQGTVIPCVLETALDSTLPGFSTCVLPRDVLGSTGTVVLLEKGTRIVGEFRGGMRQGQRRLFVLWTRAETPHGVVVNLASPAADPLGRSGFDGEVDTRFWDRFGGALLLSLVDGAVAYAGDQVGDGATRYYGYGATAGRGAAAEAIRNTINIPPVLRKNQGEEVSIFVARDLDFSGVYDVRLTGPRAR